MGRGMEMILKQAPLEMTPDQYKKIYSLLLKVEDMVSGEFYYKRHTPQTRGTWGYLFSIGIPITAGTAAIAHAPASLVQDCWLMIPAWIAFVKLTRSGYRYAHERKDVISAEIEKSKSNSESEFFLQRFAKYREWTEQMSDLLVPDELLPNSHPLSADQWKGISQLIKKIDRNVYKAIGLYQFEIDQTLSNKQEVQLTLKGLERRGLMQGMGNEERQKMVNKVECAIHLKKKDAMLRMIAEAKRRDTQNTYKDSEYRKNQESQVAKDWPRYAELIKISEEEVQLFRDKAKEGKEALMSLQQVIHANMFGLSDKKTLRDLSKHIAKDNLSRIPNVFERHRVIKGAMKTMYEAKRIEQLFEEEIKGLQKKKNPSLPWRNDRVSRKWGEYGNVIEIVQTEWRRYRRSGTSEGFHVKLPEEREART